MSRFPFAPSLLALATATLLAACGGGTEADHSAPPTEATTPDNPPQEPEPAQDADWDAQATDPARISAQEQIALAALDASLGADEVRYIVTLNPAAVAAARRGRAVALSAGHGEVEPAAATAAAAAATAAAVQTLGSTALAGTNARLQTQFTQALEGFTVAVPRSEAGTLVARLRSDPAVQAVELDRLVRLDTGSVDPAAPAAATASPAEGADGNLATLNNVPWSLDRIDQRNLPLSQSYGVTQTGAGVNVYVLDTGIRAHDEFGTRLQAGRDFIGDGRGTVDCHGHGTHVAGTIAGRAYGVAPGATLRPVRVLDCRGSGSVSGLVAALDWVRSQAKGPTVVNMSLGATSVSTALDAAVERLTQAGVTVVVAAGNSGVDACTASPARAPSAITVGASQPDDSRAVFSNFGSCLDLFAPGVAVLSAGIGGPNALTFMSGTSMASPHVAGAAALLLQKTPTLTPGQLALQLSSEATANVLKTATLGSQSPNRLLYAGSGTPTFPPRLKAVHVEGLQAAARLINMTQWNASATVTVRDAQSQPAAGVRVTWTASDRKQQLTCTTVASGQCSVAVSGLPRNSLASLTFAVSSLSGSKMVYDSTADRATSTTVSPPVQELHVAAIADRSQRWNARYWIPRAEIKVLDHSGAAARGVQVIALNPANGWRTVCVTRADGLCTLQTVISPLTTGTVNLVVQRLSDNMSTYRRDLNQVSQIALRAPAN